MSRLIDADAMKAKCGEWYTEEGTEEGFIGTLGSLLDAAPTVPAIPVEWLRKWPKDLREGAYVRDILMDWQKEQEAR